MTFGIRRSDKGLLKIILTVYSESTGLDMVEMKFYSLIKITNMKTNYTQLFHEQYSKYEEMTPPHRFTALDLIPLQETRRWKQYEALLKRANEAIKRSDKVIKKAKEILLDADSIY